jgi:methyl-galactoside transport system substrate-binding protein
MNIVDLARNADLPIIFFNREVSDAVINSYNKAVFVGTDALEAGHMQGQAIAEYLLEGDNLSKFDLNDDSQISYIMFRGWEGCPDAFTRTLYSVQNANMLLESSGYKLVPSVANETSTLFDDDGISNFFLYSNWYAETAGNLMRTALDTYSLTNGDIELIIANDDNQAIGATDALIERGFNEGNSDTDYIPVFGIDGSDVAIHVINSGRMTATILQDDPAIAEAIISLIMNIASGNDITDPIDVPRDEDTFKYRVPYWIIR